MRQAAFLIIPSLLAITACGSKPLTLGETAVDKAATCGVVAAAAARTVATDIKAPLSVEARGQMLSYALLAGSEGTQFAPETTGAVIKRMPELADAVTDTNWEKLVAPCAQEFPIASASAPQLPTDPLVSALGCDQIGSFMRKALASDPLYEEAQVRYGKLDAKMDGKVAPLLASRGMASEDKAKAQKLTAMATFAKLGPPDKLMDACIARYG
ncbi:hypothetical protein [Sphingobium boeckii]|uniref:Lipoprotein n=1 Tax=Sphingobium boeckii TaxID=1082345 RepID=A0A7W9AIM2_9SPHN|nr:hypothetical protein [Sphingobium boeckii]MBB5686169.1 hypothetical protein [Sphingobium boeckii]